MDYKTKRRELRQKNRQHLASARQAGLKVVTVSCPKRWKHDVMADFADFGYELNTTLRDSNRRKWIFCHGVCEAGLKAAMKRESGKHPVDMTSGLPYDVVSEFWKEKAKVEEIVKSLETQRLLMKGQISESDKGMLRKMLDIVASNGAIKCGKTYDDPYEVDEIGLLNQIMVCKRNTMQSQINESEKGR